MDSSKHEVVTFKVDSALSEKLNKIRNRSEFIRQALLVALDNHCPLCNGSGVLTQHQKQHWDEFIKNHSFRRCDSCMEYHLTCVASENSADEES